MTIEQKLFFGVEDVRGIRVECGHCHAALSFLLDQTIKIPEHCPACGATWKDNFKDGGKIAVLSIEQLIDALKLLRRARTEMDGRLAATMQFEFDVPQWLVGRSGGSSK